MSAPNPFANTAAAPPPAADLTPPPPAPPAPTPAVPAPTPPAPIAAPMPTPPAPAAAPAPVAPAAPVSAPAPVAPAPPAAAAPPAPIPQPLAAAAAAPPPAAPMSPAAPMPTATSMPTAPQAPVGMPPVGMPGMTRPGASSPGAGAGARFTMPKPEPPPQGQFVIRVSGFRPLVGKMKWPSLVFEVFDGGEQAKAQRGEKNVSGVKIEKTLWFDQRTMQLFRDLGWPDNTWTTHPDGNIEFPIQSIIDAKPAVLANITQKEGKTPGQMFPEIEILQLVKAKTTP